MSLDLYIDDIDATLGMGRSCPEKSLSGSQLELCLHIAFQTMQWRSLFAETLYVYVLVAALLWLEQPQF